MGNTLEQKNIDYKEKFGDRVLKDLSAFANTEGGTVIIGISKDEKVTGIDLSNKELERITDNELKQSHSSVPRNPLIVHIFYMFSNNLAILAIIRQFANRTKGNPKIIKKNTKGGKNDR